MVPGVEVVRSLTGLWGMGSQKCASYKRAQFYAQEAADQGPMWLDFIRGQHNPPDVLTKHVSGIQEYVYKTGVFCGSAPVLYETAAARVVLDNEKRNKNKKVRLFFVASFRTREM